MILYEEKRITKMIRERTVEVSEDVLNQLHAVHSFSKKKIKASFMFSSSKKLGIIKRKIKKLFRLFDSLARNEEKKNQ